MTTKRPPSSSASSTIGFKFLGVRGSRPVHHPDVLNYGGNSTCIEIKTGLDFGLLVDGGTGLQRLNSHEYRQQSRHKIIHILMTHSHWDHVIMLPLLRHLERSDHELHIHAPDVGSQTFRELYDALHKLGRLPIPRTIDTNRVFFHPIKPDQVFAIQGKIKISTFQVNHQHTTLGFKIEKGDLSMAIITDASTVANGNHLGAGMVEQASKIGKSAFEDDYNRRLIAFLKNVHTLVFDTHFNQKNLKPDWGHATPEIAIEICIQAGIKRLMMFHHAPEDRDVAVAQKQTHARKLALLHGIEVINAKEEDQWSLQSA